MSSFRDARSAGRAILTLVMVVALVTAGCGVPDSSEPEALDDAPGVGGAAAPAEAVELPKPGRNLQATDLVRNYLKIGAAADWSADLRKDERIPAAAEYARQFLSREGRATWTPSSSIDVIQVISVTQAEFYTVAVKYRRVGALDGTGTLAPAVGAEEEASFKLAPQGDTGPQLLDSVPNNLLPLSLEGLQSLFEVRPVYYWEKRNRFVVPDRRYLSKGLSPDKRVKTIVERVLAGPSPLVTEAVLDTPAKAPLDNTQLNGNNVVVNLPVSEQTDRSDALDRLASQIRWSLHPNRYSVELRVGGRNGGTYSGPGYEAVNPALPPSPGSNDQRLYAAVDGVVEPLRSGPTPSILRRPENANVVAAAVNVKQNSAALVRRVGEQDQLWVGRTPADQSATQFRQVDFKAPVTGYSRPSFLSGAGDRVLIVVNRDLYDVDLGTGEALPVLLPPIVSDPVAVAVAPDGVRVAIVTDSSAYVAMLDASKRPAVFNPSANPTQPAQEVYIGGLTDVRGVGWFSEHQIAVGGQSGLMVAAIDSGSLEQIAPDNLLGLKLTQLSAVPWNPIGGEAGNVVLEASGSSKVAGYVPYRPELIELRAPASAATPSPSASGAGPPVAPKVTAPFYADVV